MNPLEIPYLLRIIFAFLSKEDRSNIYRTCKIFRENYRWVDPREAIIRCLSKNNHRLANEICDCVGQYIQCDAILFDLACTNGNIKVVNRCIDSNIDPSYLYNRAIRMASCNGHLLVVNRLLQDPRVDPTGLDNFAIIYSSSYGKLSVVERLLQDPRVDPSYSQNQAIRMASYYGHLSVVERLLQDPRVDPSDKNNWAICVASRGGYLSVVERLLEDPRVDPSVNNNEALNNATVVHRYLVVQRLLKDPRVNHLADSKKLGGFKQTKKTENNYDDFDSYCIQLVIKWRSP